MKGNLKLREDEHALQSATPHLYLLSCQILTENIISWLSLFTPPVRSLVPMLYAVRRNFVIFGWVQDVWINKSLTPQAKIKVIYMWMKLKKPKRLNRKKPTSYGSVLVLQNQK